MGDVVLHAFNWNHDEIAANAASIREAGYGAVLFPPPLFSDELAEAWWQRYQPKDYRVIRSYLGNRASLVRAIRAVKDQRLLAYADIVFSHMANEASVRTDALDFPGRGLLERYRNPNEHFLDDWLFGDLNESLIDERSFHPCQGVRDWLDPLEVAKSLTGTLPSLTLSIWVIKQQLACLRALNELGFDGYRVDPIKHLMAEHMHCVFENPILDGKFVFSEILTLNEDENRTFLWPAVRDSRISFYDFPLQQTLKRAFSAAGSLRELVDPGSTALALPANRAVTFSLTHDLPNNDGLRDMLFDTVDEVLVNAYVLGRDGGVPLIYSDHGESIARYPEDAGRWTEYWKRPDVLGMIAFHNEMLGRPSRCLYAKDGCIVLGRESCGLVAINKTTETQYLALHQHALALGEYQCRLHGHRMLLNADPFSLSVPPRSAQMWVRQG